MKRVLLIVVGILVLFIAAAVGFYTSAMQAKNNDNTPVTIMIEGNKMEIASSLEKSGLIKSAYALDAYLFLNPTIVLQAGEYEFTSSMTPKEIIAKIQKGDIKVHTKTITLIEGQKITDYIHTMVETFPFADDLDLSNKELENKYIEFMTFDEDEDYKWLEELVNSNTYWFLGSEVLDEELYFPLEGYIFPDTYEFLESSTFQDIIIGLLNQTSLKLEPYKEAIQNSNYSLHEIFTMASIIEKEANTQEDRKKVSQVLWKRLQENWSLGSDVTTYYGARKEMGLPLTYTDLYAHNGYNTRLTDGSMNGKLPIGPVCNFDISSLESSLYPADTNYYYFVANVCTGEVFFQETNGDFLTKVYELQGLCSGNE